MVGDGLNDAPALAGTGPSFAMDGGIGRGGPRGRSPRGDDRRRRARLPAASARGGPVILESAVMTALATGALGSAHCAAMCGPLAMAGCSGDKGLSPRRTAGYFVGRTLAYGTVGAVLGHLGHHALCLLPMGALEGVAIALVVGAAAYRGIKPLHPGKKATTPSSSSAFGDRPPFSASSPSCSLSGASASALLQASCPAACSCPPGRSRQGRRARPPAPWS